MDAQNMGSDGAVHIKKMFVWLSVFTVRDNDSDIYDGCNNVGQIIH